MLKKILLSFFLLITALYACPSMARNAELLISPTRLIFEGTNKYATVTVRNNGDGVGRYKIELVDTHMTVNGGIRILKKGEEDEFTAKKIISLSPRSMTLNPDGNQVVRILIKNKKMNKLPDGEYKSHLQIRMTEGDLDLKTGKASTDGAGILMKPKMTTVIPVIVRKGESSFKITMDEATLLPNNKTVSTSYTFSGNRSVLGDIRVEHIAPDGKTTRLAFFRGIAIYRGVTKRTQDVALKIPAGLDIKKGKLVVAYMSQENETSRVLASKEITP